MFGNRKLDISKIITARCFEFGQLIEDNDEEKVIFIFELMPFAFLRAIALCKFAHRKLVIKINIKNHYIYWPQI